MRPGGEEGGGSENKALGSTVRLRFRKSMFGNYFQTEGKLKKKIVQYHTRVVMVNSNRTLKKIVHS